MISRSLCCTPPRSTSWGTGQATPPSSWQFGSTVSVHMSSKHFGFDQTWAVELQLNWFWSRWQEPISIQDDLRAPFSIHSIEKGPSPIQADLGAPFSILCIENGANNTAVLCVACSMQVEVATCQHTVLQRVQNDRSAHFFLYWVRSETLLVQSKKGSGLRV